MPAITKFFNGNPVLGTVGGGIDAFAGRTGRKRWAEIEAVIGRGWDNVVDAIDEIVTIPDVDEAAVGEGRSRTGRTRTRTRGGRGDRGDGRRRRRDRRDRCDRPTSRSPTNSPTTPRRGARQRRRLLAQGRHRPGADDDQRRHVLHAALLPRRQPIFLGRNGRISVFPSERALARYLADEHDHDLSDLATYDDIRTAATDGSLQVNVSDDNVYVLTGIADDLADGPDAIDRDQLELAVELLRDVGEYAEDTTVDESLDADQPLGRVVAMCSTRTPSAARVRRTPRPSSSGRRWRRSSNRGCARSSATARSPSGAAARTGRGRPPPGSRMLVSRPQPWSLTGPQLTPLAASCSTVALTSSHIRYSSCDRRTSAGCTATSPGGSLKISHPPPASTCGVLQHVAEERPVRVGVAAVHDHMGAGDHALTIRRDEFAARRRSARL